MLPPVHLARHGWLSKQAAAERRGGAESGVLCTIPRRRLVRDEIEHVDRGALQPWLELRVSAERTRRYHIAQGHKVVSQPASEPTQAIHS